MERYVPSYIILLALIQTGIRELLCPQYRPYIPSTQPQRFMALAVDVSVAEGTVFVRNDARTVRLLRRSPELLSPTLAADNGLMNELPGRLILPRAAALTTPQIRSGLTARVLLTTAETAMCRADVYADASAALQIAVANPEAGQLIAPHYASEDTTLDWREESPLAHFCDAARIEAFVAGVCAIHAETYVDTVQTTAELAACGLANPWRLIVVLSDGTICDVHLGRDAGGGMVYARMDRMRDVCLISRRQLAFAEYANLDGTEIPREQATALYAQLIGLQFDKTAMNAVPSGEAEAEIRFALRDGSETRVSIYPFDGHYNLVLTDGGGRFLIRREKVEDMLNTTGG